ncbi:MAG: DsbA family protein [Pseudomonadota bacterium]
MSKRLTLAAVAVGVGASFLAFSNLPKLAADEPRDSLSSEQEAAVKALIADYIEQNPEAIFEALNKYAEAEEAREAKRMEQARSEAVPFLISDEGAFTAGANTPEAKVAVVEFFDYHCGFCKRANGLVRELTASDPDVKVVFRELPILKEESEIAARFALAARDQDKYLDLHFALMGERGTLTEERILNIAEKEGLDVAKLKKAANKTDVKSAIADNYKVAGEIGVDGTPGFIIASVDGSYVELIPGFRKEDIQAAITEAKKSMS